jgi:hypothetical protein
LSSAALPPLPYSPPSSTHFDPKRDYYDETYHQSKRPISLRALPDTSGHKRSASHSFVGCHTAVRGGHMFSSSNNRNR